MDNFSSADGVTDEIWDKVLAVNLTVPVKMMRAVIPFMKEKRDGCIINVASTAAKSGAVAGVAYTASKHGLVCLFDVVVIVLVTSFLTFLFVSGAT